MNSGQHRTECWPLELEAYVVERGFGLLFDCREGKASRKLSGILENRLASLTNQKNQPDNTISGY